MNKSLKGAICAGVFLFASPVYAIPVPIQIQIEAVERAFFEPNFVGVNTSEFGKTISGFLTVHTNVIPDDAGSVFSFPGSTFAKYHDNAALTLTTFGSQGELTVTANLLDVNVGVFPNSNDSSFAAGLATAAGLNPIISDTLGLGINSVELHISRGSPGAVQDTSLPPILDLNKFLDSSANPNGPITRFNSLSITGGGSSSKTGRYVITRLGDSVLSIPGVTIPTPPPTTPTATVSSPGVLILMALGLVSLMGFVRRRHYRI